MCCYRQVIRTFLAIAVAAGSAGACVHGAAPRLGEGKDDEIRRAMLDQYIAKVSNDPVYVVGVTTTSGLIGSIDRAWVSRRSVGLDVAAELGVTAEHQALFLSGTRTSGSVTPFDDSVKLLDFPAIRRGDPGMPKNLFEASNGHGYWWFSNAVIDETGTRALVFVLAFRSGREVFGEFILLERQGGEWKLLRHANITYS